MTSLISWIPPATITALGWALIHFLWQGTAIAALTAGLMRSCRRSQVRYLIGLASLVLMLAAPLITFFLLLDAPAAPPAIGFAQIDAPAVSHLASSALRLSDAVIAPPLLHASPLDLLPWLVEAWFVGVALLCLRFTGSVLLLGQAHRGQSGAPSARLLALCEEVQERLGIHRTILYLECHRLQAPVGFGCIRPVILLPLAALTGLSEEQLRAVIAHELAHIRRWDFSVNIFQVAVETLLFYHPAIWWLNRRIRAEREICCDEVAVSTYGNAVEYARALAFLAEWRNAPAMAMAINQGMLTDRILRLVRGERFDVRSFVAGMAGSLLLLILSLAGGNALLASRAPDAGQNIRPVLTRVLEITAPEAITAIDQMPRTKPHAAAKIATKRLSRASIPPEPPTPAVTPNEDAASASQTNLSPVTTPVADDQTVSGEPAARGESEDVVRRVDDEYPAPALNLNASHGLGEWTEAEAIDYCRDYAAQTVTQGANRPISVDEGVKQRLSFFYWHCMFRNGQTRGDIDLNVHVPAYRPVGTASPDRPVNVSGTWAISLSPFPPTRSCTFAQTGNSISGTCARSEGGGVAQGVVDGRQVRWSWIYLDDEKRLVELDFIGMIGADGVMRGQAIPNQSGGVARQIQPFTAVPGAPVTQVASQK